MDRVLLTHTPWTAAIPFPPNETPLPFQLPAARFLLERNRSYLAADPGLGKTIIAMLAANALSISRDMMPAIAYLCPPFLMPNVENEVDRWTLVQMSRERVRPGIRPTDDLLLIPDSLVGRAQIVVAIEHWAAEMRAKNRETVLFVDEAHRFKNADSQRTKALFGFKPKGEAEVRGVVDSFDRVVLMSGTPMVNGRPMELYAPLAKLAPETIDHMNVFEYGRKFCAGHRNQFGWDFSGASNLDELKRRTQPKFMLRLRKADVLKDLPPKTEDLVLIEEAMPEKLFKMDQKLLVAYSPEKTFRRGPSVAGELPDGDHVASHRRELGIAKAPLAVSYIHSLLSETDEALLVFAWHKDVIRILADGLKEFSPLIITGDVDKEKRFERVKLFQSDPAYRVMILNIQAGGVGFNLTKASRGVFVEFSWVPGENDQASDRMHRIGQRDNVYLQYLVYKNSMDREVLESNFRKRKHTNRI